MKISTLSTTSAARAAALGLGFVGSILFTFTVVLTLRNLGVLPTPRALTDQKTMGEFIIRFSLMCFLASSYFIVFWNKPIREWFLDQRWRLVMLILFGMGTISAMADPYHPIRGEYNWIRYWTAGVLIFAGAIAIVNAFRRIHPICDRVFGSMFGSLLILASADEIIQFHEKTGDYLASALQLQPSGEANDIPTLVIAALGVVALGALILLRHFGGRLGRLLQTERYRIPLRLFAFSVVTFAVATTLDSCDIYLQDGINFLREQMLGSLGGLQDRLWLALTDIRALANTIEELLEYLAALGFLMMVGTLFSITALGAGNRTDST